MSDDDQKEKRISYSITFSLDRTGQFRRECPDCGRAFKTKGEPSDIASAVQPAFQRLGQELGEEPSHSTTDAEGSSPQRLSCPYCGTKSEVSEMLSTTFAEYVKNMITREVLLPKVNQMFSDLEDQFGQTGPRSTGMFSLEIKFEHNPSLLPARPISGPEPPDMTLVTLLCCDKTIKVLDGWRDTIYCPYCDAKLALQ
jgi:hypothetical protein